MASSNPVDAGPKQSSFEQIRNTLLSSYGVLGPLSPTISEFVFASSNHLYYFGSLTPGAPESILMLDMNSADVENQSAVQILDPQCARCVSRNLTPEQELLFERKRISPKPSGIDSFEIELNSSCFLMTAGTNLLTGYPSETEGGSITPEVLSLPHAVNAKLCPTNPALMAFVRQSNLHMSHLPTKQEFKVSDIAPEEVAAGVSAGMASFLVQEDMDRYEGFWWRPAPPKSEKQNNFSLLYEVVDDHEVDVKPLYNPLTSHVTKQRYPIPGASISKCDLLVADFSLFTDTSGETNVSLKRRRLSNPLWELITGAEYLLRVGWVPAGDSVWVQVLSRDQQELQLIEIPLSCFRTAEEWETSAAESSSILRLLFREKSEYWINSSDLFSILPSVDCIEFIIASSETYFQHLYHVTVPSAVPSELETTSCGAYALQDLTHVCKITQLTEGEWVVNKEHMWVDHDNKLVYYLACSVTPTEQHLHVSSYASQQTHKVLTQPGYYVECDAMDAKCRFAVLTSSNLSTCPEIKLCRINSSPTVSEVELVTLKILHKSAPYPSTFSTPQIHKFKKKDGVDIYCMHSVPKNAPPDTKHPLLVYVYGGPMFRIVKNVFCVGLLRTQVFGDQGFSVLITDNTGSTDRGLNFEGAIQNKLGQIEVSDQVDAIHYIDETTHQIDMSKIAIHGWSYGGYLSFLSLAQRPDIFRVAVCGGTVQDWNIYESAYTEKYMGTPLSNPEGYEKGCCEYYVDGLPHEPGRLFFLHGQIDENVHFTHVEKLIAAILKIGAPYQLNIFPGERHGVRSFSSRLQMNTSLISFIKEGFKI